MRFKAGSTIAVATLLLSLAAFLPSLPNSRLSGIAHAQSTPSIVAADNSLSDEEISAEFENKLATRIKPQFEDVIVRDVFAYLEEQFKIDIVVSPEITNSSEILDLNYALKLKNSSMSLRNCLNHILRTVSHSTGQGFRWVARDGVILIVPESDEYEVAVYDVSDIVPETPVSPALPSAGGVGAGLLGGGRAGGGGIGMGMFQLGGADTKQPKSVQCATCLANSANQINRPTLSGVVMDMIDPETWMSTGGNGQACEYEGMLIVYNSPSTQAKVKKLLQMLREAKH